MIDSVYDEYTTDWVGNFQEALDDFRKHFAIAKKEKKGEYWDNYGMYTQAGASAASKLELRHKFFTKKCLEYLNRY